jgi:hypothetical protein
VHLFEEQQIVRFTDRAQKDPAIKGDNDIHNIIGIEPVPNVFAVPPEYAGFSGLIGQYAGKLSRDLVGHTQWLILENGKKYSGALLEPA